jgi:hypothetical protein
MTPTPGELADAITRATRSAVGGLFSTHAGERFYYCALITSGFGAPPELCAWSYEALAECVAKAGPEAEEYLKWSYADSPYYGFGSEHFAEVRAVFARRPSMRELEGKAFLAEYEVRISAMEEALQRLEAEGLFGTGAQREGLVVNAEVMPPDYTNTARARRLNPAAALVVWLREIAEPEI